MLLNKENIFLRPLEVVLINLGWSNISWGRKSQI